MAEDQKILIAEISDNTTWYDYWPYAQNVWLVRTNNVYTDIADPAYELDNIGLINTLHILSFQVNKEPYTKVFTIADVSDTKKSWYFNNTDKSLYIHFEDHKPFYYYSAAAIEIGFVLGVYKTNSGSNGRWNEQQYYHRLLSNPVFPDKKDDVFNSKQVLPSGNIEFDNHDLRFKNFNIGQNVKRRTGDFVRTLVWTGPDSTLAAYGDFDVTYQGVIDKVSEGKTIKLKLRDLRSTLTVKSPDRYIDNPTLNYPYIKDPEKEYILPELWGKCFDVPCICLNQDVNKDKDVLASPGTAVDYQFLICDTSKHTIGDAIQDFYIDGIKSDLTAPTVQFNTAQSLAYFEVPESAFRDVEVDDVGVVDKIKWKFQDKVTIDCHGYLKGDDFKESDGSLVDPGNVTDLIENGLAVLREIIKNNYDWDYTSVFYDISTWEGFEDAAYEVGYYLNEPITTQKQIEKLAFTQLGKFLWKADRKFSFSNEDFTGYEFEIPKTELFPLDYFPTFTTDASEVLSIFRVGYKRKWAQTEAELSYEWDIDSSNQDYALTEYNSTYEKNFPTLINNLTDAAAYAGRVLFFGKDSQDTFTINTKWDKFDLKAGQWVLVQADYGSGIYLSWVKCQVLQVVPRADNWTVDIQLRIFEAFQQLTFDSVPALFDGALAVVEEF